MPLKSRAEQITEAAAAMPDGVAGGSTIAEVRAAIATAAENAPNFKDDGRIQRFATIADLRAVDITNWQTGDAVIILGDGAIGNGAGGPIRYLSKGQPAGTYVDNGGSIIVPTGGDGSAAWLDALPPFISVGTIYTFGDSLTERGFYQTRLESRLGRSWKTVNRGIGGNTTTDLVGRLSSGEVIGNTGANYCVVWCGVNDAISNFATATIKSNLQSIYTDLKNAGFYVIALTIAPYKDSPYYNSGGQAIVDDVNSWILATATDVHVKVDTYPILEDPSNPDKLLPSYDLGDHIHHSAAGAYAVADAIYSAVTWTQPSKTARLCIASDSNIYLNQSLGTGDRVKYKSLKLDAGSLSSPSLVITPGPYSAALVPGAIEISTTRLAYTTKETIPQRYELAIVGDLPGDNPAFNRVSVGPTPLSYPLSVFKDDSISFVYKRTGVSAKAWGFSSDNDFTYFSNIDDALTALKIGNAGNLAFPYYGAGTLTTDSSGNVTASSDASLKNIDGDFTRGLADLLQITPKLYHWRANSGLDPHTQYAGMIAQDVQSAIPEAVGTGHNGMLTLSDRPLIAALVNAVKELSCRLEKLEGKSLNST